MGSARIQGLEYDVLNVDPAAISELDTYTDARAALVLISDTVSSGDVADHADYPVGNSPMEGMNNKIKVIKRKAYGYHDIEYFVLKVKQAFAA